MAWQQKPVTSPPPVNYSAIQAQQANQQALLMDQLQKNQVQEEQRQRNAAAIRRPFANDPTATGALDLSDQAQRDRYNARQRDLLDRYRAATSVAPVLPQPSSPPKQKSSSSTTAPNPPQH
ncbi:hypothetical protein [Dyella subtropica]|uniref:hypothetical protein n=1 Tax=Dyella subtropica TaxID=2992127 RepID=UPI002251C323|nr:hypothetical protein [Dyella subtropica]